MREFPTAIIGDSVVRPFVKILENFEAEAQGFKSLDDVGAGDQPCVQPAAVGGCESRFPRDRGFEASEGQTREREPLDRLPDALRLRLVAPRDSVSDADVSRGERFLCFDDRLESTNLGFDEGEVDEGREDWLGLLAGGVQNRLAGLPGDARSRLQSERDWRLPGGFFVGCQPTERAG